MRFDLTDLRLFLHTAEAGSITAGAERAHLTLASASAPAKIADSAGTTGPVGAHVMVGTLEEGLAMWNLRR